MDPPDDSIRDPLMRPVRLLICSLALVLLLSAVDAEARTRPIRRYRPGRYAGMNQVQALLYFLARGSQTTDMRLVMPVVCFSKIDGSRSEVTWPLGSAELDPYPIYIERSGRFDGAFDMQEGLFAGVSVHIWGRLRGRRGQAEVSVESDSDAENCFGYEIIDLHLVRGQ